jgi:hypothetical protein
MGHAGNSRGDLYDEIKEDVPFGKMSTENCGAGFELPSCTECTENCRTPAYGFTVAQARRLLLRLKEGRTSRLTFIPGEHDVSHLPGCPGCTCRGEQVSGAERTPTPDRLGALLKLPTLVAGTSVGAKRFGGTCYQATGSRAGKPGDGAAWTGSTRLTVKRSKISTFIR